MSDRVLVMKDGRVVEHGTAEAVFTDPQAPYTRELLGALTRLETSPAGDDPRPIPPPDGDRP